MDRRMRLFFYLFLALSTAAVSVDVAYQHSPLWSYKIGGKVNSMEYNKDKIFVGSDDNILYAISKNGYLSWKYPADNVITGLHAGDDIVFSSMDGLIYMVDYNGTTKWSRRLPSYVGYDKAIHSRNGIVSVGLVNGVIYVLDKYGAEIGEYNTGGYVLETRVLEDRIIAVSDRQVFSLDLNGTLVGTFNLNKFVRTASVTDDYVVVGLNDGEVYCYDVSGTLFWAYKTDDQIGTVHADKNLVSAGTKNKRLFLFNVNSSLMWQRDTSDSIAATFISEPYVAVSTLDNKVYLYYTDGRLKWIYPTEGRVLNLLISDKYLISGTNGGWVDLSELPQKSKDEVMFVAASVAVLLLFAFLISVRSILKT